MDSTPQGSVTIWLDRLKQGQECAAQELWNRYFVQLVGVARGRIQSFAPDRDGEDIALSALKSAMLGVQNNRFPDLTDRTGLWPLLVAITARKAANERERHQAKKRNRRLERPLIDEQSVAGSDPSPDFALRLADEISSLVHKLGDSTLQIIAQRKLEGYDNEEIAKELSVSTRTIVRKLARIRQEWDEGC
jgi:DNA-directed RNA polymerase specialized sigma24 family protein